MRFCEAVLKLSSAKRIRLVTSYEDKTQQQDVQEKMKDLAQSLLDMDLVLDVEFNQNLHDRVIRFDNGSVIKIGRGLVFYQKPLSRYHVGASGVSLRKCVEIKVDVFRVAV